MAYHQIPSSPPYQYDAFSPVSPISMNQDTQRHLTHTPKRRRVGSDNPSDFDPGAQPFVPHDEMFDFSYSPPVDFGHRSPPPIPQHVPALAPSWDLDFRWDDPQSLNNHVDQFESQQRLHDAMNNRPQFSNYLHHAPEPNRAFRAPVDYYSWNLQRAPAPPPPLPPYLRQPPMPNGLPSGSPRVHVSQLLPSTPVPNPPSLQRAPPVLVQPPQPVPVPSQNIRRKGSITLTLSRANENSIEDLPEHKRECPACQLEFEPDNYLAVISCCGTAMHATCFSAWVNSQTYSKTKVCMKCRKAIDARRPLNNVVPPVTDKSWDQGVDFDAPPHVLADTKTEIDISGRNESIYRRYAHMRRDPNYYRRRAPLISENEIPLDSRPAFHELQRDIRKESDELRARYRAARHEWRTAFETEARVAQSVVEAKDALHAGIGMTQREVDGLSERLKEAKEAQEHRHILYRAVSRELDEQERRHQTRQAAFLQLVLRRGEK